jgi:cell division transport system ATP-binding protein
MTDTRAEEAPLIVVEGLGKRYGRVPVLDGVSFTVARGDFVVLVGPTGAGKSTLLRLLAALEQPSAGRILIAGVAVERLKDDACAALRRTIGVVPQDLLLLHDRSALANVMLPASIAGIGRTEGRMRAQSALKRVGVDDGSKLPAALSGGQRQRVALARALVSQPAVLLADEPAAHLDPDSTAEVLRLLEGFADSGIAVVIATHSEIESLPARARILRLDSGRIVQ